MAPKYKPAGAMMYVNAGNCFRPLCPTAFELRCLCFHASLEGNAKFEYLAKHTFRFMYSLMFYQL